MKMKSAQVAVAFVLVNVQIVKNVHLVKIINPLNQIKFFLINIPKIRSFLKDFLFNAINTI